jgi:hypothetical protein
MPDIRFTIRLAVRALRAAPLVTSLAILSIGLGIGAVTTVYSTASAFTLHPLPQFAEPDRLLMIADAPVRSPTTASTMAAGTFIDLASLKEFSATEALTTFVANIVGDDLPERATAARVTAGFFRLAGRTPLLARLPA